MGESDLEKVLEFVKERLADPLQTTIRAKPMQEAARLGRVVELQRVAEFIQTLMPEPETTEEDDDGAVAIETF